MTAPLIWVLADERRGTANQALGVATALGLPFEVKDIRHGPLARLPNLLLGASRLGLAAESSSALAAPWPDLIIASGRRAGAAARWIKRQSNTRGGRKARLVQIMHPGAMGAGEYDLIVVPRHDRASGPNVLEIDGAPHGVTEAVLAEVRAAWADRFAGFAKPIVGLLLGGATIRRPFDAAAGRALGTQAAMAVRNAGGSLVVTSSPRTGAAYDGVLAGIAEAGVAPAFAYRWGEGGDNPYLGFLALCDALVVTGDSVSMLCEACAGTQPVYLYAPAGFATAKHERLHRDLIEGGLVRRFEGRIETWSHAPLNAAGQVADEIKRRFLS